MALESKLYTALTGSTLISVLSSNRVYPVRAPQNATYPHIIYTRISGNQMNGLKGYLTVENPAIQVDTYSTAYSQAKTLSGNIHTVIDGTTTFRGVLISDNDIFEDDVKKYRVSQDFSCINLE